MYSSFRFLIYCLIFSASVFVLTEQGFSQAVEVCSNQIDDDGNGLIDCEDPECAIEGFSANYINGFNGNRSVACIDYNGDGLMDLVQGSGNAIRAQLNLGNRRYELQTVATLGIQTTDLDFADLNGDALLDVFAISSQSNDAYVFIRENTGAYVQQGNPIAIPESASRTKLTDVDLDGDFDAVVLAGRTDNGITGGLFRVYINDGSGGFSLGQSYGNVYGLYLFDFDLNGDGILDFYAGSTSGGSLGTDKIFLSNGSGGFAVSSLNNSLLYYAAAGDINGDGSEELLVGYDGKIWTWDGSIQTILYDNVAAGYGSTLSGIQLFDFNNDGSLDLYTGIESYLNDGTGLFQELLYVERGSTRHSIRSDFDGDGVDDLLLGSSVLIYGGDPVDISHQELYGPILVEVVDYDQDGDQDALIASKNTGTFTPNHGIALSNLTGGVFETHLYTGVQSSCYTEPKNLEFFVEEQVGLTGFATVRSRLALSGCSQAHMQIFEAPGVGSGPNQLHSFYVSGCQNGSFADLDNDGDLDFFVCRDGGDQVWLSNGNVSFSNIGQSLGSSDSLCVSLGDIDKDGDIDAIVGAYEGPDKVYLNNGVGFFTLQQSLGANLTAANVELVDLNNDTFLDVYVQNSGAPDYIYLNDGAGQFIASSSIFSAESSPDSSPLGLSFGDLDSDGDLDLCITSGNSPQIYINNGAGFFSEWFGELPVSSGKKFSFGDFDNDGAMDLLVVRESNVSRILYNISSCSLDDDLDGINNPCDIDVTNGTDCDFNGQDDSCQDDGDGDGIIDPCDDDLDNDGIPNDCDADHGVGSDCNSNLILDICDISQGDSADCNQDLIPDECQYDPSLDCNQNGLLDSCDILLGISLDCSGNGVPDECEISNGSVPDCNGNGVPDSCDYANDADCNVNGVIDACDILLGIEEDCDGDGLPDSCYYDPSLDCDSNGVVDFCDIASGAAIDCDSNGVIDFCETVNDLEPPVFDFVPEDITVFADSTSTFGACGAIAEWPELTVIDNCGLQSVVSNFYSGDIYLLGTSIVEYVAMDESGNSSTASFTITVLNLVDPDCDGDGIPDLCEESFGDDVDSDGNGIPDNCEPEEFRRGDSNQDGQLDVSDCVSVLELLFGSQTSSCLDSADMNDDGALNIADTVYGLSFLFNGGPEPADPGPVNCAPDPTEDSLDCESYLGC